MSSGGWCRLWTAVLLFALFAAVCSDPTTKPPDKPQRIEATQDILPPTLNNSIIIANDVTQITLNGQLEELFFAIRNTTKFTLEAFAAPDGACFNVSRECKGRFKWDANWLKFLNSSVATMGPNELATGAKPVTTSFDETDVHLGTQQHSCILQRKPFNGTHQLIALQLSTCDASAGPLRFDVPKTTPLMVFEPPDPETSTNGTETAGESTLTYVYIGVGVVVVAIIIGGGIAAFFYVKKKRNSDALKNAPSATQVETAVEKKTSMATALPKDGTRKDTLKPTDASEQEGKKPEGWSRSERKPATGAVSALKSVVTSKEANTQTKGKATTAKNAKQSMAK